MLYLYKQSDALPKDMDIITNAVGYFCLLKLDPEDELTQRAFKLLEKGELISSSDYIDRFGYKLPIEFTSGGLKSILTVLHNSDKLVYCLEAGINAISVMAAVCHDGHAVIIDNDEGLTDYGYPIDVMLDNVHYTDFKEELEE